jgi:hypothetical protein
MKERENYETIKEATLLSTKEIRGNQGDHGDQGSSILINMINPLLVGSSDLRIC